MKLDFEFASDQLNSTNHSLLLEVFSSASCQHILTECVRSCTYMDTLPFIYKKIKLLFQGVVFASFYHKNSLNEAESRICFGISFQVLAPGIQKTFYSIQAEAEEFRIHQLFLCYISKYST